MVAKQRGFSMNAYTQALLKPIATFLTKDSPVTYTTHVILGSIFLAVMSQIAIPLPYTAVPFTLQTLAVFILAMAQGKNKAALSVITFLGQASMGLPVIAGGIVNPLWMVGPTAGYLVGFVIAAYVVGYLIEKNYSNNWMMTACSFAVGEAIILSTGTLWLAVSFGFQTAVVVGFVPFLLNGLIKIVMATTLEKPLDYLYKSLS